MREQVCCRQGDRYLWWACPVVLSSEHLAICWEVCCSVGWPVMVSQMVHFLAHLCGTCDRFGNFFSNMPICNSVIRWALITVYSLHFILDLLGTIPLQMQEINHATCLYFLHQCKLYGKLDSLLTSITTSKESKNTHETIFCTIMYKRTYKYSDQVSLI